MLEEIIEEGQTSILTYIDSINSVYPERIFEYQKGAWRNRKAYTLEFDSTPTTGSDKLVNSGCVAKNTQLFFSVDALTPPTNPKEGDIWDRPAYSQVCPSMSGIGYFPTATLPVTIPLADGTTSINLTIYKTDSTQDVLTDISEFPKTYPAGVVSAFAIDPAIGTPTQDLPAAKMVYHSGSWVDIDTMFASQQIQSDWDQADNTAKDFIKNKPSIPVAIDTVNVTVGNNTGTPTGSGSVSGSKLSLAFDNIKGPAGASGTSAVLGVVTYAATETAPSALAWDTIHKFPVMTGLTFTLQSVPSDNNEHTVVIVLDTPADASNYNLNYDSSILWANGDNPASSIENNTRYEIRISSASMIAVYTKVSLPTS